MSLRWALVGMLLAACDEDCTRPWYRDLDGDGVGDSDQVVEACTAPQAYVAEPGDCEDDNRFVTPGAFDECNGIDDDCDGLVDEDEDEDVRYLDADQDGVGSAVSWSGCGAPPDRFTAAVSGDCDDLDPSVSPSRDEVCNGRDDDCDGMVDEGVRNPPTLHADADGDGFGAAFVVDVRCPEPGWVANPDDCDDSDEHVFPGADEVCNGRDDDCDFTVDENPIDGVLAHVDFDRDGWGSNVQVVACEGDLFGYIENPYGYYTYSYEVPVAFTTGDCDDYLSLVNPDAPERCSGMDDNCNGLVDDDDPTLGDAYQIQWYADLDRDGYGDPAIEVSSCGTVPSFVANPDDCDDGEDRIHPGQPELCNGFDDDCDGRVDDEQVSCP